MNRKLILAFGCLLLAANSFAQIPVVSKAAKALPKFTLGVKAGANFQKLSSSSDFQQSYKGGFTAGVFAGLHKNKIGVKVEALIKSAQFPAYERDITGQVIGTTNINTMYLDVPVLFEYNLIPRVSVQVGPQFSDMLSAKNSGTDVKSVFKTSDFSAVVGLEARLPLHFIAGARYVMGLTDVNAGELSGATWNNRAFQLYIGYRLL
jgi:Outer membrane protein beta-barrel domain